MKECVKTASPPTGHTQSGGSSPRAAGVVWTRVHSRAAQPARCHMTAPPVWLRWHFKPSCPLDDTGKLGIFFFSFNFQHLWERKVTLTQTPPSKHSPRCLHQKQARPSPGLSLPGYQGCRLHYLCLGNSIKFRNKQEYKHTNPLHFITNTA